jgi:hypothetical protein
MAVSPSKKGHGLHINVLMNEIRAESHALSRKSSAQAEKLFFLSQTNLRGVQLALFISFSSS